MQLLTLVFKENQSLNNFIILVTLKISLVVKLLLLLKVTSFIQKLSNICKFK